MRFTFSLSLSSLYTISLSPLKATNLFPSLGPKSQPLYFQASVISARAEKKSFLFSWKGFSRAEKIKASFSLFFWGEEETLVIFITCPIFHLLLMLAVSLLFGWLMVQKLRLYLWCKERQRRSLKWYKQQLWWRHSGKKWGFLLLEEENPMSPF